MFPRHLDLTFPPPSTVENLLSVRPCVGDTVVSEHCVLRSFHREYPGSVTKSIFSLNLYYFLISKVIVLLIINSKKMNRYKVKSDIPSLILGPRH